MFRAEWHPHSNQAHAQYGSIFLVPSENGYYRGIVQVGNIYFKIIFVAWPSLRRDLTT